MQFKYYMRIIYYIEARTSLHQKYINTFDIVARNRCIILD